MKKVKLRFWHIRKIKEVKDLHKYIQPQEGYDILINPDTYEKITKNIHSYGLSKIEDRYYTPLKRIQTIVGIDLQIAKFSFLLSESIKKGVLQWQKQTKKTKIKLN